VTQLQKSQRREALSFNHHEKSLLPRKRKKQEIDEVVKGANIRDSIK